MKISIQEMTDFLRGISTQTKLDDDEGEALRAIADWIELREQASTAEKAYLQLGDTFIALSADSNIAMVEVHAHVIVDDARRYAIIHMRGVTTHQLHENAPEFHALLAWLKKNSRILLGGKIANWESEEQE